MQPEPAHRYATHSPRAGDIFQLILSGKATSRTALEHYSGLSRATVSQRLDALFAARLIVETRATLPSGGRPARVLGVAAQSRLVLAAHIGERTVRMALTDIRASILAERIANVDVTAGPVHILGEIANAFRALLREAGRDAPDVLGIGLSLPAPVDYQNARASGPSIMRGWDGFDIRGWFAHEGMASVMADNDVNLMAMTEHQLYRRDTDHFIFIKVGTGIGSGIIIEKRIYRGAQGAAGDVGHIQFSSTDAPLCRCGKLGCVEARAGGWAIARDLRAFGFKVEDARGVMDLVADGRPEAVHLIRQAARVIGEVVADIVSMFNPSLIVIGGTLADSGEHLLSGIKEIVYQRCLPLAAHRLEITTASTNARAALIGAALMIIQENLQPENIERMLESTRPV